MSAVALTDNEIPDLSPGNSDAPRPTLKTGAARAAAQITAPENNDDDDDNDILAENTANIAEENNTHGDPANTSGKEDACSYHPRNQVEKSKRDKPGQKSIEKPAVKLSKRAAIEVSSSDQDIPAQIPAKKSKIEVAVPGKREGGCYMPTTPKHRETAPVFESPAAFTAAVGRRGAEVLSLPIPGGMSAAEKRRLGRTLRATADALDLSAEE